MSISVHSWLNTGEARLRVASVHGRSVVVNSLSRNPLRVLTPRSGSASVWAYTSTFGGGMVAGDRTRLDVTVDTSATCFLSTQASTKIYRNPRQLPCSHEMHAELAEDSLLILAPDPVQCFADSTYSQQQRFFLRPTANLVLVDWISGGRTARGERWSFRRYSSRNEVTRAGRLILFDSLVLDQEHGPLAESARVGGFNCLATVLLLGPRLQAAAAACLNEIKECPVESGAGLQFSASPFHEGALLRIAGTSVEDVSRFIASRLHFLTEWLHDDPWSRKW